MLVFRRELRAALRGGGGRAPVGQPVERGWARHAILSSGSAAVSQFRERHRDNPYVDRRLPRPGAAVLKQRCGTGGTVREGRIEVQGDQRERLAAELEKMGYRVKRVGG